MEAAVYTPHSGLASLRAILFMLFGPVAGGKKGNRGKSVEGIC